MMATGLVLIALSGIGLDAPVRGRVVQAPLSLESLLRSIASPLADVVTNYGDVKDLTSENEQLRSDNERLNAEIARLREDATQRQQLERLLDVKNSLKDQTFVTAKVFARDPSNLRQVIAISRARATGSRSVCPW